jgi:hypothetical protein
MAFIALNGDYGIPQPSALTEEIKQKVVDRVSIKGVIHRYWEAQKKQATMEFSMLNQAQYSKLIGFFYNQGGTRHYSNAQSGFDYVGFATVAEAQYVPGADFLKNMTVTIIEK